ncbi:hypothetical protein, partial [Streptomyces inhibens]|uniref:hypothetical protein n=1 Tax=Streptomyces inhibens TaxID=2293571 RepID=UPI001C6EDC2B
RPVGRPRPIAFPFAFTSAFVLGNGTVRPRTRPRSLRPLRAARADARLRTPPAAGTGRRAAPATPR